MTTDLPKNIIRLLAALLKHQAEKWVGDETLADLIGKDLEKRLDEWLHSDETAQELLLAAEKAQLYLQDPKNCPDNDLRGLVRGMGFGDLPSVQEALKDLPEAMGTHVVTEMLRKALERDAPSLSPEQVEEGAKLYADALLSAVGSLEKFTIPVIRQVVLANAKKLDALDIGQARIERLLEALVARELSSAPPSPTLPGDLPPGSHLPIQPNPAFTGRAAELKALAEVLVAEDGSMVINQQALVGMGGIGKTQLAVEFAWAQGYRFAGVHWVSAYNPEQAETATSEQIEASIAACGQAMCLRPWPDDVKQQVALTLAAWKESGPRLVVLDNLEDMEAAAYWLPRLRHSNVRILVTSRQQAAWDALDIQTLPLLVFEEAESLDFLRQFLSPERATDEELVALHERLGGLPLALDLAAAYLKRVKTLSVIGYLEKLSLDHKSLKNWRKKYPNATQHDKDVASTFALSLEKVEEVAALVVFVLAGYGIPNQPLREDVLREAAGLDDAAYGDALDLLESLSLVEAGPSLHPLLSEFARLQDADGATCYRWAQVLARRCYPGSAHGGIYRDPALVLHARYGLADMGRAAGMREDAEGSNLRFHVAFLLRHFGDLDGAMNLYKESLQIKEGLGDRKGKAATLHEMAGIYVTRGDLDGAMNLYKEALSILEGLGDLQGKSATLHAMADILRVRGDLDGAMNLYKEALSILEGLGDLQGKSRHPGHAGAGSDCP